MVVEQQSKKTGDNIPRTLRDVSERLELIIGNLGGLTDLVQLEEVISSAPAPLVHGSSNPIASKHAKRVFDDLVMAKDVAERLFAILDEQVEMAEEQMEALTLRNGISSLPDDVLSTILLYATRPKRLSEFAHDDAWKTQQEIGSFYDALSLSHACSRFRSLSLNNPRMWNFLSDQFDNVDLILHCIKYSKSVPLDVCKDYIGGTHTASSFEDIVSACLTASERWRCLAFGQSDLLADNDGEEEEEEDEEEEEEWDLQTFLDNATTFSRLTKGIEFPSLTTLDIYYRYGPSSINLREERFHPHLHWSLPSLERFSFSGAIPLPFNNSIKQVSICFIYRQDRILDARQMQAFFASCSSLQSAKLLLSDWQSAIPNDTLKIPGVKDVDIRFSCCSMIAVRAIWGALYFQDAENMALGLLKSGHAQDYGTDPLHFGIPIEELLLQHSYIGLRSLDIEACPPNGLVEGIRAPYLPPFTKLPSLLHLKLSSKFWPSTRLLEVPPDVRIPALRSLAVNSGLFHWHHVSEWVVALMARLEAQGDLDRFEVLRIEEVYSREELEDHMRKPSDLEGNIHDYLPEDKIVFEQKCYD